MSDKQIELLNGLEAYAQAAFGNHGRFCRNKSGLFDFHGVSVYFQKKPHNVVKLVVFGEEFDCVIEN